MPFLTRFKSNHKLVLFTFLLFIFIISLICFMFSFRGFRYTFTFPEAGSSHSIIEVRSLKKDSGRSKIQMYTEELLAGPSVERARPLFPSGTRVLFCFQKGRSVYVNLSKDALFDFSQGYNLRERSVLLEKNITANFRYINKLHLFIDGNSVFEDSKIQ